MDIVVTAAGLSGTPSIRWPGHSAPCAIGRAGIATDNNKREGDGTTPVGRFPLRGILYRPDRLAPPPTGLPARPIDPGDGWCDDPADPAYNRPVRLPYAASHEKMWRDDGLYDLVMVIGHNDTPVVPGLGSAVFVHVAEAGYPPTAGCVALALPDLQALVAACRLGDRLLIEAG